MQGTSHNDRGVVKVKRRRVRIAVPLMEDMKRDPALEAKVLAELPNARIDDHPTSREENFYTPFYEGEFDEVLK